ncbi:phosphoglucosamine mutase [Candidatus Woesearchaeota archaeon]|nr:phosphoglucosamine mutase [Candidatus Woesearchaeota archaeon]
MALFGTDGIRGKVNVYPVTADAALGLGRAFVSFLGSGKKVKVVVGRDTRLSSSMLESALIAGITSAGGDALPLGVVPSNAVSHFLLLNGCGGGVMVSASHNPADENGFKFFSSDGFKLSEAAEAQFESVFNSKKIASSPVPGSVFRLHDVKDSYISMVKDSLRGLDISGLRVGVDAGNGSASYFVKDLFSELGVEAVIINNKPDGYNINLNCGALFPAQLQALVKGNKLDAGVAFDGDADRLSVVDEFGNVADGDSVIGIAALSMKKLGRLRGNSVVVTDYSNSGLDSSLAANGISVLRVKVGDRQVSDALFKNSFSVGGEKSGHVIFPEFARTADAVLASVQVLSAVKEGGKRVSELASFVEVYPQALLNVRVREKKPVEGMPSVVSLIEKAGAALGGNGRVFVRYSGTENTLRILVEGKDESEVKKLAEGIASAADLEVGVE